MAAMTSQWKRTRRRLAIPGAAVFLIACGPSGPVEGPRLQAPESAVEYPIELWDMGIEGETTLMVHVTEAGQVDSVQVAVTSGIPDFDSAAVQASRRMRFTPARRDGARIPAWTRLPIRFQRNVETPAQGATNRDEPGQGGN